MEIIMDRTTDTVFVSLGDFDENQNWMDWGDEPDIWVVLEYGHQDEPDDVMHVYNPITNHLGVVKTVEFQDSRRQLTPEAVETLHRWIKK